MANQQQASHVNPVQVQKFLGGVDYPCSKDDLIKSAKKDGADDQVIKTLQKLPDKQYDAPIDVNKEIGKIE